MAFLSIDADDKNFHEDKNLSLFTIVHLALNIERIEDE